MIRSLPMVLRSLTVTLDLARPAAASSSSGVLDLIFDGAMALVFVVPAGLFAWLYLRGVLQRRQLATWPREPAKILVLDRIEQPGEEVFPKTYEVAIVLELKGPNHGAHRIELKTSMDRHLFDYVRPGEGEVFVFVDPTHPGQFVLDEAALWARKERHDKARHLKHLEEEAAAEREAEEKRQRVLRGD